jgi:pimeloyl-ACP methyl ester carboxylesterase
MGEVMRISSCRWRFRAVAVGLSLASAGAEPLAGQAAGSSPPPPAVARYAALTHVRMYYEQYGQGPALVLLHGGASTIQASFGRQLADLARVRTVTALEQRGHGHTRDVPGAYRYTDLADDTAELLDRLGIRAADVVGWSDGANIGLMLAVRRPDLVRRLVVSGANVVPGAQAITAQTQALIRDYRPERDTVRQTEYARQSGDSNAGWAVVIAKLKRLWLEHPTPAEVRPADLARIRAPTLVMAGDRDAIGLDHTLEIYRAIPGASLFIVPATGHATFRERSAWIDPVILAFLDGPPPE